MLRQEKDNAAAEKKIRTAMEDLGSKLGDEDKKIALNRVVGLVLAKPDESADQDSFYEAVQFVTDGSAPKAWTHVTNVCPPSCDVHTTGTSATKSWYAT